MPSTVKEKGVTGRVAVQSLTHADRQRIASEIGDMFEATFEERLEMWKRRDAEDVLPQLGDVSPLRPTPATRPTS
jgi:hypothetical protein